MDNLRKKYDELSEWAHTIGIHILYLMVGDGVDSSSVQAKNLIKTPSNELAAMWSSLNVTPGMVYHFLLHEKTPQLLQRSQRALELERKSEQKKSTSNMYHAFGVRMKFLLDRHGLASFPSHSLVNKHLAWCELPTLLRTKKFRFVGVPPSAQAPPFGAFKPAKLPQHVAAIIWKAVGPWVDPMHVGPTDTAGHTLMGLVPWSDAEKALGENDDEVPIMVDTSGGVVARVKDIPSLAASYASFTRVDCSQRYSNVPKSLSALPSLHATASMPSSSSLPQFSPSYPVLSGSSQSSSVQPSVLPSATPLATAPPYFALLDQDSVAYHETSTGSINPADHASNFVPFVQPQQSVQPVVESDVDINLSDADFARLLPFFLGSSA
jgi:hypothetical protein